jgi:carbon starvation protein
MSLAALALAFLVLLALGYRVYGGWVARRLAVDDARVTPACERDDGIDFVPTRPFYLFGQHFSAISAAGPIAGPILACQVFGWLPCLLWIAFGVVFIGAVHDFASLTASVRHGARSVAEIAREHLGGPAGRALLAFIWIALVYVIVAFTNITANSFVSGTEELAGERRFDPGGAVAAASTMYLLLAVVMGLVQRILKPPLWLVSAVFVPSTFAVAWLGTRVSEVLALDYRAWAVVILVYCAIASLTPLWALLQPRGYLGGFVLYTALGLGVIGTLFGGYAIEQPAFKTWHAPGMTGALFPFLFVTIACGACSGFHGLVCSGTTSKQVARESHLRPIGYGAMLAEAFVALIALVTVMIVSDADLAGVPPGKVYGDGIGRFMTLVIGPEHLPFAITFGAMAFSTFVFDTLDVCTRLGRYIVQELCGWSGHAGALAGTLLTVAPPLLLVLASDKNAYLQYWILFGASNQLLAAMTLLAIGVWLVQSGRGAAFVLLPMLFVLTMTLWAMVHLAVSSYRQSQGFDGPLANAVAATALAALAVFLLFSGVREVRARRAPALT